MEAADEAAGSVAADEFLDLGLWEHFFDAAATDGGPLRALAEDVRAQLEVRARRATTFIPSRLALGSSVPVPGPSPNVSPRRPPVTDPSRACLPSSRSPSSAQAGRRVLPRTDAREAILRRLERIHADAAARAATLPDGARAALTDARALAADYAPLRATVRYWSVVAGEPPTVRNPTPDHRHREANDADPPAEENRAFEFRASGSPTPPPPATATSTSTSRRGVAAESLRRVLLGAVEGFPSIGFAGAADLAARHRRRDPALTSPGWFRALVLGDSAASFAAGTLLSLGGPAAAPITAPPALATYYTIRMRLCLAIAELGGESALDPKAGASALTCFFGGDPDRVLEYRPRRETTTARDATNAEDDRAIENDEGNEKGNVKTKTDVLVGEGTEGRRVGGETVAARAARVAWEAAASVLDAGGAARDDAVRAASRDAERAAAAVAARTKTRGEGEERRDDESAAEDAAREAYSLSFPRRLAIAVAERAFSASNAATVAAELVPLVSSTLTVRAAEAAARRHVPNLVAAARTGEETPTGDDGERDATNATTTRATTSSTPSNVVAAAVGAFVGATARVAGEAASNAARDGWRAATDAARDATAAARLWAAPTIPGTGIDGSPGAKRATVDSGAGGIV